MFDGTLPAPGLTAHTRSKIVALYAVLIAANLAAWIWALLAFQDYPVLLGTALLAYSLGLRHAVDADHIAAIDNVTRKLMQEGRQPVGIGFYFSLGHSTIVVLASAAIALLAGALDGRLERVHEIGGVIGTSISALFLFAIAAANLFVLRSVYRAFKVARRGGAVHAETMEAVLSQRGLLGRLFRPVFRLIRRSWHMYPLGFLFGLGFDTATEIGVLGISAVEASRGLPIWSIMVFPALFTAGMSLIDATDSVLMLRAYGWAFVKPVRKLYYNLVITGVSVVAALVIGGVEAVALLAEKLGLAGGAWDWIVALSENFGMLGYAIIAFFALSWAVSAAIYRFKRYDEIEPSGA
jgi:high-affinity nickel-transport protein